MKKLLALLLALMMLLSLAACGEKEPSIADIEKPDVAQQETEPEAPAEEEEPEDSLTVHENTYFTVAFDEADGWTLAEDDIYTYETGGGVYVRILDEEGNTDIVVSIDADQEDPTGFREALEVNGFDQKAYAEGGVETTDVGGQPMVYVDQGNGDRFFFGRNAEAGVSYTIDASNWEDPRVAKLVEGITCTASATDNIDPPWYWEGTPFSAETAAPMVGTYTLTSEFLPITEPLVTFETFEHAIAVYGSTAYIAADGVLKVYEFDGSALTFVKDVELDGEYTCIDVTTDGTVILSEFMEPTIGFDGEQIVFSYDGPDYFAAAPDGTWGISYFTSGDSCEKYTIADGAMTGEAFAFAEVDIISTLRVDDTYIYVTGTPVEGEGHQIFIYDHAGTLVHQLDNTTDDFGLGSVTFVTKTANGFLALDGNMRDVVLWNADGTCIGAVEDDELFGTSYPWFCSAEQLEDGSVICIMTEDRTDGSAMELIAFRLSGF